MIAARSLPEMRSPSDTWLLASANDNLSLDGRPPALPRRRLLELKKQLGPELAPLEADNPSDACRLFREHWDKQPDGVKWRYALRAGQYLRAYADLTGHLESAETAVILVRASRAFADDAADAANQIGLALTTLGTLDANSVVLAEAVTAYREAVENAASRPASFLGRVQINLAVSLTDLGKHAPAKAKAGYLDEAARLLESVTGAPQNLFPLDVPRAYDNYGNTLTELERVDDAISAYQAALDLWPNDRRDDRARTLNNLSTAYRQTRRFQQAIDLCAEALRLQSPDDMPIAWARTKGNQAGAMLGLAVLTANRQPDQFRHRAANAIQAFKDARARFNPDWNAALWSESSLELANTMILLGLFLCDPASDSTENEQTEGLSYLYQAQNLLRADKVWRLPERHKIQYDQLLTALDSQINGVLEQSRQEYGMADPIELKAKILALFDESGASLNERVQTLAALAAEFDGKTPRLPSEVTDRRTPAHAPELYSERGIRADLGRKENIVEFLQRVYGPWITASAPIMTRPDLRRVDPDAEMALRNWLREPKHELPKGIAIPTKSEAVQAQLTQLNDVARVRAARNLIRAHDRHQKRAER